MPYCKYAVTRCPKCDRCFQRLDTHLRVSATCRDVQGRRVCLPAPPSRSVSAISTSHSNSTASCLNSSVTLHGNLNSTVTTTAVATTLETPQDRSTLPALHFNHPLRLPRSPEEWEEADHLLSSVTTSVHQFFRPAQQKRKTPVCVLVSTTSSLFVLGQGLLQAPNSSTLKSQTA